MIVAKLSRHGNSYAINVPRKMLAQLNWMPGDLVELHAANGKLWARALKLKRTALASWKGALDDRTTESAC